MRSSKSLENRLKILIQIDLHRFYGHFWWRRLIAAVAILLGLLIVVVAGFVLWIWYSEPRLDGSIEVAGASRPVEILRDRHGVPHIVAASPEDAYFGLGYVHAQDRFFQMEQQRRLAAGRLSELMGSATLRFDRFFRLLDFAGLAKQDLERLDPATRRALDAYAAGVNAYLATRHGAASPELAVLFADDPEPWRPEDTIAWLKVMALHLSGNWRQEILRARMVELIGEERTEEFFPPYAPEAPIILDEALKTVNLPASPATDALLDLLPRPGNGSNSWVADGGMTASGMPLLANDPHLGLGVPGIWYMAYLEAPGLSVVGATLPGIPAIIVGHNGAIAWGVTNTGPDTQDLFIERVDPEDPARYLTPEGSEPFSLREETVAVRFGADETVTLRGTRHGPVLSDVSPYDTAGVADEGEVVALAWTMLSPDDRSIQAALTLHTARSWDEFVAAGRDYRGPEQSVVYADTAGHVGLYAPAVVPIRRNGQGLVPVPGWSGDYDWIGAIPYDDLPRIVDPPRGYIATANEKIVGDDYTYFLGADFEAGYRSQRIRDLIDERHDHDVESFAAIQADTRSLMAIDFLPYALQAEPGTELGRAMRGMLGGFTGDMAADAAEPLIFAAWYRELTRLIYADDLGDTFFDGWWHRPTFTHAVVEGRLADWCDDVTTEAVETCHDLAGLAFDRAGNFLKARYGKDPTAWRWGEAHTASFGHRLYQYFPLVSSLTELRVPVGGDYFTVNVGAYVFNDDSAVFTDVHGASMRAIFDLADLDRSGFVWAPGQSGHIFSPYYDDMLAAWRDNRLVTIPADIERVDMAHRLILVPASNR